MSWCALACAGVHCTVRRAVAGCRAASGSDAPQTPAAVSCSTRLVHVALAKGGNSSSSLLTANNVCTRAEVQLRAQGLFPLFSSGSRHMSPPTRRPQGAGPQGVPGRCARVCDGCQSNTLVNYESGWVGLGRPGWANPPHLCVRRAVMGQPSPLPCPQRPLADKSRVQLVKYAKST